ncbi:MAG: hypothetical protein AAF599_15810 [Bacteroidota bacterium]
MNNMMFRFFLATILLSVTLLTACNEEDDLPDDVIVDCENFDSPIPNEERTQTLFPTTGFKNFQYCEVLPVFECGDNFVTEVYASLTHNDCPDADWFALNAEDLKAQFGMVDVHLNGPRHWVVNGLASNAGGETNDYDKVVSFGNIEMSLQAQIQSAFSDGDRYEESEVLRTTTYTYAAGNEVYKLISPQGEEYIMQSYSRLIDRDQSIDDLATLGDRLNLSTGWSFQTEVLETEFLLVTEGLAFVITDDFENAYQKIVE